MSVSSRSSPCRRSNTAVRHPFFARHILCPAAFAAEYCRLAFYLLIMAAALLWRAVLRVRGQKSASEPLQACCRQPESISRKPPEDPAPPPCISREKTGPCCRTTSFAPLLPAVLQPDFRPLIKEWLKHSSRPVTALCVPPVLSLGNVIHYPNWRAESIIPLYPQRKPRQEQRVFLPACRQALEVGPCLFWCGFILVDYRIPVLNAGKQKPARSLSFPCPVFALGCPAWMLAENQLALSRLASAVAALVIHRSRQEIEALEWAANQALRPSEDYRRAMRHEIDQQMRPMRTAASLVCCTALSCFLFSSLTGALSPVTAAESEHLHLYQPVFCVEYGQNPSLDPSSYGYDDQYASSMRIESEQIRKQYGLDRDADQKLVLHTDDGLLPCGEYEMTLVCRKQTLPFQLIVQDTVPPVFTHAQSNIVLEQGEPLELQEWFEAEDAAHVTLSTDSSYDIWTPGSYDLMVTACDPSGNTTAVSAVLNIHEAEMS